MTVPKRCCASTRAQFVNNEAVTPADSTSAACCNVWDFGTLGWQLSNKYYTDCRNGWKGRDGNFWAVFGRGCILVWAIERPTSIASLS